MTDPFPTAFHFNVTFGDEVDAQACTFQEVSGLESGLDVQSAVEGGENRFVHQLPKPTKSTNLKLKRGVSPANASLISWCKQVIESDFSQRIEAKSLRVDLLDTKGRSQASWTVTNAYPVKWSVGAFDAMKNELAIETIELAYTTIKRST